MEPRMPGPRLVGPLRLALAGLLVAASARTALAHDYWLELSKFRPAAGEAVLVSHRVGERLAGEAVRRNPLAIVRFDLVAADGAATAVPGRDGVDPAGFLKVGAAGPARIVFQSTRSFVELLPEKFAAYLELEGLEKIAQERKRLGKEKELAREAFSRSAAAQICIAPPGSSETSEVPPMPVGLDLEIVPERDLCAVRAGSEVGFRVLFRGQPAEGLLAMALSRENPSTPLVARTDRRGRVTFKLDRAGFWLIKAVEMRSLADEAKADWESYWASLTFELAAGTP
jgi:uncharacterized GH25 family protein